MSGNRVTVALASALMTSVALVAPSLAADFLESSPVVVSDDSPVFVLTGTVGVVGMAMPEFDTGVFGHTAGGLMIGATAGGSVTALLGNVGEYGTFVTARGFGTFAFGSSSWTDTMTGPGTVIITGLTTPNAGSIALDANGVAVSSSVTGAQGGLANTGIFAPGATVNIGVVTPDAPGFVVGALTTDTGGNAAAYGGIGDDSGGIFIATGDIDGLAINTTVSRRLFYGGADLALGLVGIMDGGVVVQGYVGPSYRGLFQTDTTRININIPEEQPSTIILPEFTISHEDRLDSHYLGGIIGGNFTIPGEGVSYTLGLEGGIYSVSASWNGQDTYSTCCGLDGAVPPVPSPTLSVSGPTMTGGLGSTIAFAARGNAAVSYPLEDGKIITLGGGVEYLSHVAQVDHSGLTTVIPGADIAAFPPAPAAPTTTLSWGHMLNFSATVSLTGTF